MKHHEVWKFMDQQCSALVKHIVKCFSCLSLSLTYVISLNRNWSIIYIFLSDLPFVRKFVWKYLFVCLSFHVSLLFCILYNLLIFVLYLGDQLRRAICFLVTVLYIVLLIFIFMLLLHSWLNKLIDWLIDLSLNDCLLDAWPTVIPMSPQLINISHRILIAPLL